MIPSMRPPSPSAPWISSSPSAAMIPPDDFADADVVQYSGGGAEPYGSRGTGSGSYWANEPLPSSALTRGESSGGLVKVDMPQVSASGRHSSGSRSEPSYTEAASSSVEGGVHSFRVQLLGDGGSASKDVVCKVRERLSTCSGAEPLVPAPLSSPSCTAQEADGRSQLVWQQ